MADIKELIRYRDNLQAAFDAQYPELTTSIFKRIDDDFALPAIVVNLPVLVPDINGNMPKGKLRATVQTAAFVLFSAADEANELECIQLGASVANFISNNRFGETFPAKVTLIEPMIVEGLEEFYIQRIDFEQNIEILSQK